MKTLVVLMLGLVLLAGVASPQAAENVNAVAAFYANGTYKLVDWDHAADLQSLERYLVIAVYHVLSPGLPYVITVSGNDIAAVRRIPGGLVVREISLPPTPQGDSGVLQHFFQEGTGVQQIGQRLPGPSVAAVGGMHAVLQLKDPGDADFEALETRANDKSFELRSAPVPSEGTY